MISPRIPRIVLRAARALSPHRAPDHLSLIRQLHCCVCWALPPSDPDHLMKVEGYGPKGIARKHPDRFTVPLCRADHTGNGKDCAQFSPLGHEAWLAFKGIDGRALADALWAATGDLEEMGRINFAHHQRGRLRRQRVVNNNGKDHGS